MQIVGIKLVDNKPLYLALTGIYGIGKSLGIKICNSCKIPINKKAKDLTDNQVQKITENLKNYTILGELTNARKNAVLDLINIKCNRGIRHIKRYPVRGQNTRNNAVSAKRAKRW